MHYYEVAPRIIVRANSQFFTYSSTEKLAVGQLVLIEVGKKTISGVVLRQTTAPQYATKPVIETIESQPLPAEIVRLGLWLSDYYATHLATVLQTILPAGLTKNRRAQTQDKLASQRAERTNFVFTPDQQSAIGQVSDMTPGTALLHGITGSGKTAVYMDLARQNLAAGKSVIILVPEIALTSQLVSEFAAHFDDIVLAHSRQTEAQRHKVWQTCLNSTKPMVAIGPRSALFLPLRNVGLVVIDEAHEPSFKQEQSPRYSALRAASMLAGFHQAKLILGSATPSVSDYYLAEHSKRPIITMPNLARTDAVRPTVRLIDATKRTGFKQHRFLSDDLIKQLADTFASGKQALIFHNRRGSASTTLCESCGWQAMCPHCFLPLTLHIDQHHLRCHVCGQTESVPTSCPDCGDADIIHKGIGTKLIESELRKLFPEQTIGRFDGDTQTGETVEQKYSQLKSGEIDLIIGTQVIAKGLDLPQLRTVGVIQADSGLSLPDYGSSERTFQLLAQVIGRVGRSHHATTVIVQTYQPTAPAITHGLEQDYESFYKVTLAERQRNQFPPFVYLLRLTCIYKTEAAAIKNAKKLASEIRQVSDSTIQILGPTPAFYERQRDTYRWQLIIKSSARHKLVKLLDKVPSTHWQAELDPISLL